MIFGNEKRRQMTERMLENENANIRIKALLTEFMNPEYEMEMSGLTLLASKKYFVFMKILF